MISVEFMFLDKKNGLENYSRKRLNTFVSVSLAQMFCRIRKPIQIDSSTSFFLFEND